MANDDFAVVDYLYELLKFYKHFIILNVFNSFWCTKFSNFDQWELSNWLLYSFILTPEVFDCFIVFWPKTNESCTFKTQIEVEIGYFSSSLGFNISNSDLRLQNFFGFVFSHQKCRFIITYLIDSRIYDFKITVSMFLLTVRLM